MQIKPNTDGSTELINEAPPQKQYLISDKNFQLLKQYQQIIFEATELSASMRKILNELITVENLEKIKVKFIEIWKQ